jgi:ABC-type polysaccharide/polyol phosphate export permease
MISLFRRELITSLVSRELTSRYKGSSLGVLWSIITPLFMAVIYAFFFRLIAGIRAPVEAIVIGVFAWQFTAVSVNSGMMCITGNSNLIKKVAFPRSSLPVAVVLAGMMDYLISLIIQVIIVSVLLFQTGNHISWTIIAIPLVLLWHAVFNLSLAMILSAFNVYFRDTQHLVSVLLSAFFFLSPAMYDLGFVRDRVASHPWIMDLYMLNPLSVIITWYRKLMLPGVAFEWTLSAWIGLALPAVMLLVAVGVFKRMQKNFADYV